MNKGQLIVLEGIDGCGKGTQIKKAAKLINEAERPLIIAGRGVNISHAYGELKQLA